MPFEKHYIKVNTQAILPYPAKYFIQVPQIKFHTSYIVHRTSYIVQNN